MNKNVIKDLSSQLKEIAKDLTFLGHPRYELKKLHSLFPQHKEFIDCLEDVSTPFTVQIGEKRKSMDHFLQNLESTNAPFELKKIFSNRVHDYQILLTMMEHFGTADFYQSCTKLYGSSKTVIESKSFSNLLEKIPDFCRLDDGQLKIKGDEAIFYLKQRLLETFNEKNFEVKASSSLLSDSSAGRRTLKLNPHKEYTIKELEIFLVHEGWVHLGTSLNGLAQENNLWLGTWAPRTTFLQEGLAIIVELITGSMTHERWHKIVLRHSATSMAENGAAIKDVYTYFLDNKMKSLDSFKMALRVFRGVPLEGGMAFTKELLYLNGMVKLLTHLRLSGTDLKSFWVGKISFEEHATLMRDWSSVKPEIKFFPKELSSVETQKKLHHLKELCIDTTVR